MAKLDLIKSGEFKELSAQVFEQTLGSSEGTYTAVLDEKEELAVVQEILDGCEEAKNFILSYWEHYAPFNSAADLLIEHLTYPATADILLSVIKRWSLPVELAKKLCQSIVASSDANYLRIINEWLNNHRTISSRPELVFWCEKIDGCYDTHLCDKYRALFEP